MNSKSSREQHINRTEHERNPFMQNSLAIIALSAHSEKGSSYSPYMRTVAWSILVMGLSLVAIIIAYVSFGHIGPSFSSDLLVKQQAELREQYDLPPKPVITNDSLLLIPPSLRDIGQSSKSM